MMTVGPLAAKRIGSAGWANSALSFSLICSSTSSMWTTRPRKLVADFVDDLLGRLDAHVGLDQHLEEFVEKRLVDQAALRS